MDENSYRKISLIKEVGLFALIVGVFAGVINLMGVFEAIQVSSTVSGSLLAGGLKYTMFTVVYGMIVYLTSLLFWFFLNWRLDRLLVGDQE